MRCSEFVYRQCVKECVLVWSLASEVMNAGPCSNAQDLSKMGVMDKFRFAGSCSAPWPCADGANTRLRKRPASSRRARASVLPDKCKHGRDYEKCPIGARAAAVPQAFPRHGVDAQDGQMSEAVFVAAPRGS